MKKILLALGLVIASLGGLFGISGAGAAVPCSISGGDQGWYWHGPKVMQCVQDGNHIVIRQYGSGGVDEGVVLDAWMPASAYYWAVSTGPGNPTNFIFCPATWAGTHTMLTTQQSPLPSGWEQKFAWINNDNSTWDAGAINHFLNWPGLQAYGAYAHLTGGCPYGGHSTTFGVG